MKVVGLAVLVLAFVGVTAVEAAVYEMFPQEEDTPVMAARAAPQKGALLRTRHGHGHPTQHRTLPAPQDQAAYPFFAGTVYTTTVARVSQGYGGAEIVEGAIPETGTMSLSVYTAEGERHEVHFAESGRSYIAATLPDGTMAVREYDPSLEPRWNECMEVGGAPTENPMMAAAAVGDVEIDVMMVFDTTAVTWANANGGVTNFAVSAVSRMNAALANSGIACTMRLVDTYCPNYTYGGDFYTTLYALADGVGGLGGVAAQRNACGADVVAMMVDTGSSGGTTGLGWVTSDAAHAFSVCAVQAANVSHTMSHEIGHNLGCGHSKEQTGGAGDYIYAPYAAGWYFTGNNHTRYHTIMAYNYNGGLFYQPCNYFSTPLLNFQGVPIGDAQDADNTRCIQERMATVAAFKTPLMQPAPPVTVIASDGTYKEHVRVSWSFARGATTYKVYRHTLNNSAGASLLATLNNAILQYNDTTAAPQAIYYYWVKSSNGANDSAFSPMASGSKAPPFSFAEALNAPSLEWTTGGHAPWFTQKSVTHDGVHAAQSGDIGDDQISWIETSVTGPGTLTFRWRVSSETSCDLLKFYTNTIHQAGVISGSTSWAQRNFTLSSGTHILRWSYEKNARYFNGSDCGWLDDVQWSPTQTQNSPRPVPHYWLMEMYPGYSGNYETLATDPGLNGHLIWESYVAGLVPTNKSSRFTARITFVNDHPIIEWDPDLGAKRAYTVWGNAALDAGGWMKTAPDAVGNGMRFFKVEVDLP